MAAAGSRRPITPVWAAAPGQACVLDDGEVVLAAGGSSRRAGRSGLTRPGLAPVRASRVPVRERHAAPRTGAPILGVVIGPAPVLALLVGVFHTALYVLLRGSAGAQLPLLLLAAFLGAWAGDELGGRLGLDILRIGDFRLVAASLMAWAGIGLVALVAILGPTRRARAG